MPFSLPMDIGRPKAPPIKCQGIKTKLTPFIARTICWSGKGRWIEPFLGSGSVLFNLAPPRALGSDTNPHIVQFYRDIQTGAIDSRIVRGFLEDAGQALARLGECYFYEMRQEFNRSGGSLRFLFLNRSCFNGMMRFNASGSFNVPFGKNPERFRKAYVTKIVNQVRVVERVLAATEYEFRVADFRSVLSKVTSDDFVYLDPPYIGRHTDYFGRWTEHDATELARLTRNSPAGYALSMWLENRYRRNDHIERLWPGGVVRTIRHYYHVGAGEHLRNGITEALVIRPGFQSTPPRTCHDQTTSSRARSSDRESSRS